MSDILMVDDIQKLTDKGYHTALGYLKIACQHKKIGNTYAILKDDFVKWANQNNIELKEETEVVQ